MPHIPTVLIATERGDLHALVIKRHIDDGGAITCHILETDAVSGNEQLTWELANVHNALIPTADGGISASDIDVIWWRRSGRLQSTVAETADTAHRDLIDNDCYASIQGILMTAFRGTWIDHPHSTQLAENKLRQLCTARRMGWRVPETLVTQNPDVVAAFRQRHPEIVVKSVKGTRHAHLPTRLVTSDEPVDPGSIAMSPTIYQEFIPGQTHLRVFAFGDTVMATRIDSPDVDWRWNLDVPFTTEKLNGDVERHLLSTLTELNLTMGVFDLKAVGRPGEYSDGDLVWLEVNPQGQFLFAEGLTGTDHAQPFAAHLRARAMNAAATSR